MQAIRGCLIEPPRINLRGMRTDCSVLTCESEAAGFCRFHLRDLCQDHLDLHTRKYAKTLDLLAAPVLA